MGNRYDIFISYAREDHDEVVNLINRIKHDVPSLRYWFDINGVESGEEFQQKIISAIEFSDIILFAVSQCSINSSWVQKEVLYAKNIGKKVIPVLLKGAKLNGWALFNFGMIDCVNSANQLEMTKFIRIFSKDVAIVTDAKLSNKKSWRWLYVTGLIILIATAGLYIYPCLSEKQGLKESVYATARFDFVDLGLSVKWATENILIGDGCAEDGYFAWGHVETYKSTDLNHSHTYGREMNDISNNHLYDIAAHVSNSSCRIPTLAEFQELVDKCRWVWKQVDGMHGYEITGPNGNSIFLPANGYLHGDESVKYGVTGNYWTSSSDTSDEQNTKAYSLGFNRKKFYLKPNLRGHGFCIRPVSI